MDTTGDAGVVRCLDPTLVAPGLGLGGLILQLRGIDPDAIQLSRGVAIRRELRRAVHSGALPPECATLWLDSGVYPGEIYAKFSIHPERYDAHHWRGVIARWLAYLRSLPGFAGARITRHGKPGIRDAGRIRGEYCLTEDDIKTARVFPDPACRAAWPIEHWRPGSGLDLEYLPEGQSYAIPLRSLRVAGHDNLWAAGKCLSAEPRAQASARVAGTCWAMGEAVGKALLGSTPQVTAADQRRGLAPVVRLHPTPPAPGMDRLTGG